MNNKIQNLLIALAMLFSFNLQLSTLHAQGTAFTYQGWLNDSGQPANGTNYGMVFYLYDAPTNGNLLGDLGIVSVAVSNGLFTVPLDFGNEFDGTPRWLQISVQKNGGAFTQLAPRQSVTPTPYAIYAANASSASSVAAANITGTVPLAQLPGVVLTNNESGVSLSGTFGGNAASLTNLNPANLSAGTAAINISGNAATAASVNGNVYAPMPNLNPVLILPGAPPAGIANDGTNTYRDNIDSIQLGDLYYQPVALFADQTITNNVPGWDPSIPRSPFVHLADPDYYEGYLYVPMEAFSAPINSPPGNNNDYILIFKAPGDGDGIPYAAISVSNYQSEVSAVTIAPNFSNSTAMFVSDWSNTSPTNEIFEYTLNNLTNATFVKALSLSDSSLTNIGALKYVDGILYAMQSHSKLIYEINPSNGLMTTVQTVNSLPECGGLDVYQGMLAVDGAMRATYCYNFFGLPTIDTNQNLNGVFNGSLGSSIGGLLPDSCISTNLTRTWTGIWQSFGGGVQIYNANEGDLYFGGQSSRGTGVLGNPSPGVWSLGYDSGNYWPGTYYSPRPYNDVIGWTATGAYVNGGFTNVGGSFVGNGGGLTSLNPANLSAGTAAINISGTAATATTAANVSGNIADAQLSANVALLNRTNSFTGTNNFAGVVIATNATNVIYGTFTGSGAGLKNVSANAITGGLTVNLAVLVSGGGTNTLCFTNGVLMAIQ